MYVPCQIMDLSSLESQATSVAAVGGFCCPCSSSRPRPPPRPRVPSADLYYELPQTFQREVEDPETVFSRHRAAVIAGHRFLTNHGGILNLQNITPPEAPPLPQIDPPPLPPRRLSSFFPPIEPMNLSRNSGENQDQLRTQFFLVNNNAEVIDEMPPPPKRKEKHRKATQTSPILQPLPLDVNVADNNDKNNGAPAMHRGSNPGIACPYLSPIDVVRKYNKAATSWEWDFGNNETLRSQNSPMTNSDHESRATDRVNIWGDPPVVKKGLLMQQREKMWSRWKERYFILTRDYLHCFRRLRNVYRFHITLSAMGQFIYKLRLANVNDIKWDTRRSYSRICLTVRHESTILLRSSEDNVEALYHWYTILQECISMSKIRRQALRVFHTSSEEDTSSHSNNPSDFSPNMFMVQDGSVGHNSSYTLGTSSGTSGGSSQSDILEIYRRVGGTLLRSSKANSSANLGSNAMLTTSTTNASVHAPPSNRPSSRRGSGSFYLSDRPPSVAGRPQTQIFKRFPLPALDSESEIDEHELHNILDGLPKRCSNPTREMEGSSQSGGNPSAEAAVTAARLPRKETPSPAFTDNGDEIDHDDNDIEDDLDVNYITNNEASPVRCESRITLRDFVKTPWRSSSALPPAPSPTTQMIRDMRESTFENGSRLSAFPIPSRRPVLPQRPVSSFSRPDPPHGVFGGRKVLPTPWTKKNPTLQIGKGAAFSRSNVIVCPSKLSADVTYLRRV